MDSYQFVGLKLANRELNRKTGLCSIYLQFSFVTFIKSPFPSPATPRFIWFPALCIKEQTAIHCNFHLLNTQEFLIEETMILIWMVGAVICILYCI